MANKSFEDRYLDLLEKGLGSVQQEIAENSNLTRQVLTQAEKTNGRVTSLEKRTGKIEQKLTKKFLPDLDNKTIYIIALCFLVLLIIITRVLHIDLKALGL